MTRSIVIHADCRSPVDLGDYLFGCKIAKDLAQDSRTNGIDVVLVSSSSGVEKFAILYGAIENGYLSLDGQRIKVSILDDFDGVANEVIAYIEANRCEPALPAQIKRILSASSKFLSVYAANRDITDLTQAYFNIATQQAPLFKYFSVSDVYLGISGIGAERNGLPGIQSRGQLPELNAAQKTKIPQSSYGVMYLHSNDEKGYKMMAQYIQLTQLDTYVLIGKFNDEKTVIENFIFKDLVTSGLSFEKAAPAIIYYKQVENVLMRELIANSRAPVVISTGTWSVLEASIDGKLSFYEDLIQNVGVVKSYFAALDAYFKDNGEYTQSMRTDILQLSRLLFAPKPLSDLDLQKTQVLLAKSEVVRGLQGAQQHIVSKACGKLAGSLLSFIGSPITTTHLSQRNAALLELRYQGESTIPSCEEALRRAAEHGMLFELRVLLKGMTVDDINKKQATGFLYSALHLAVINKQIDCIKELMHAGADTQSSDWIGKTPMDYALAMLNNTSIVETLTYKMMVM